jgi:hypothetical protein
LATPWAKATFARQRGIAESMNANFITHPFLQTSFLESAHRGLSVGAAAEADSAHAGTIALHLSKGFLLLGGMLSPFGPRHAHPARLGARTCYAFITALDLVILTGFFLLCVLRGRTGCGEERCNSQNPDSLHTSLHSPIWWALWLSQYIIREVKETTNM